MIAVKNRKIIENLSFEEYLSLGGYSYSGLKNEGKEFVTTEKMKLGTQIHNFLLEPQKYQASSNHNIVRAAGSTILSTFGALWYAMKFEVSVTADFVYSGELSLPYRGRIDILVPNAMIIDLKVSEVELSKSIPLFGYDNQLSGYGIATNIKDLFIVRINPKTLKTELKRIEIKTEFWENTIVMNGSSAS